MKYFHHKKEPRGFALLVSVILVSSFLLVAVLQNSAIVGMLFDEANHKEHRLLAVRSALTCLDRAMLELTHDYFFEVDALSSVSYAKGQCSIVSVGETNGGLSGDGHQTITVVGISSGIRATIVAQVILSDRNIRLQSEKTFF